MSTFHDQCLKKVCYHCGLFYQKLAGLKSKKNYSAYKAKDPNENSNVPVPPEKFCYNCQSKYFTPLSRAGRKEAVENLVNEIRDTFYSFKEHSQDDCDVCEQFVDQDTASVQGKKIGRAHV